MLGGLGCAMVLIRKRMDAGHLDMSLHGCASVTVLVRMAARIRPLIGLDLAPGVLVWRAPIAGRRKLVDLGRGALARMDRRLLAGLDNVGSCRMESAGVGGDRRGVASLLRGVEGVAGAW